MNQSPRLPKWQKKRKEYLKYPFSLSADVYEYMHIFNCSYCYFDLVDLLWVTGSFYEYFLSPRKPNDVQEASSLRSVGFEIQSIFPIEILRSWKGGPSPPTNMSM